MKFLKFIPTILLTATIFTSCESTDDEVEVTDETLVGTWSVTDIAINLDATFNFGELPFVYDVNSVGDNYDMTITFSETSATADGSYDLVTNGTLNGIAIDEDIETIAVDNETITYTFEDGVLMFDDELIDAEVEDLDIEGLDFGSQYDVTLNSAGELIMTYYAEETVTQEGETVDFTVDSQLILTKID